MQSSKPQRRGQSVHFGPGIRHSLRAQIDALGCRKAFLVATARQTPIIRDLAEGLGDRLAGVFMGAVPHTPVPVTSNALRQARRVGADCLVALGGGAAIGLGKALAWHMNVPQLALPTTYAGSEATPILGETENGLKTTRTDPRILPAVILYDPELVLTLPPDVTTTSGLNAIAHAAEALYAQDRSEQATNLATEGLCAMITALPKVRATPNDLAAREDTQRGAYACGAVLGQVGMALHHKLCHTLGGTFDLPHADTHAIILPHAIAFNAETEPALLAPLHDLVGGASPGMGLWHFAQSMGAPLALRDLGLRETDLDRATERALAKPYWNPRPLDAPNIRALLQNAWAGAPPCATVP